MTVEWIRHGPTTAGLFPPDQFGLVATEIGPNETRPMRAAEVLAEFPEVLACINGPMFSRCARERGQAAGESQAHWYAQLGCLVADYRQQSGGLDLPGRNPHEGATFSIVPRLDGTAWVSCARGDVVHPDAAAALQGYPPLVIDGTLPTLRPDAERSGRGAFGLHSSGRLGILATSMGMQDLQRECRALGFSWMVYLDGGGSLVVASRTFRIGSREDRPVGSWVCILEPSGLRDAWRYSTTHPLTSAAIAGGLVAGGVLLYRVLATRPRSR